MHVGVENPVPQGLVEKDREDLPRERRAIHARLIERRKVRKRDPIDPARRHDALRRQRPMDSRDEEAVLGSRRLGDLGRSSGL